MCRRTKIYGLVLLVIGISFIISCFFSNWLIRLLIGAAFLIAGLLVSNQR